MRETDLGAQACFSFWLLQVKMARWLLPAMTWLSRYNSDCLVEALDDPSHLKRLQPRLLRTFFKQ